MSFRCAFGIHGSHPYFAVRNDDMWFGECFRCGTQVVKKHGGRWRPVPRGYRVVWRSRSGDTTA